MATKNGNDPSRILIVKLSSIGDVAHALPVVSAIKTDNPQRFIGWVVRERCASLLRGCPDIDKLYVIPDLPSPAELWKLAGQLRADHYDTALDMQGLALSGVIAVLSGAKRRIGLDRNREGNFIFLTDHSVPGSDAECHAMDVQYGFADALGVPIKRGTVPVQSYLADGDASFASELLGDLDHPLIALNVGASTIYKQWPPAHWAELGKRIVAAGGSILLLGSPADSATVGEIEAAIGIGPHVRNIAGKTNLRQLASVLAQCDLMVSGDTGPMHIAVDVGVPCVAIHGPTSPNAYGPYGEHNIVIWKHLTCSPCNRNPTCNGRVDCLKQISATEVMDAVVKLLPNLAGAVPTLQATAR